MIFHTAKDALDVDLGTADTGPHGRSAAPAPAAIKSSSIPSWSASALAPAVRTQTPATETFSGAPESGAGHSPAPTATAAGPQFAPGNGQVVIYEIYGGGGNSGSTYKNDYIVLHNPTGAAISVAGWSVQYAAATLGNWSVTNLSGSIPAGGYYLVQEAVGAGGTTSLPTPDATGTIALSATAGKVALVNSTAALTGTNPTGPTVLDLVGFGATANGFEGSGPTAAPSNTTSVTRINFGNTDTNSNSADFTTSTPTPLNTSSAPHIAGTTVSISPASITHAEGDTGLTGYDYTVTRVGDTSATSSVTYSVTGSSASAADATDFSGGVLPTGMVSFAVGETTKVIHIDVAADTTFEADEQFTVTLGTPTGATIGTGSATGVITNDDASPTPLLSIDNITIAEGDSGTTTATFTVTLDQAAGPGGVTFDIRTDDGTATAGSDYVAKVLTSQTIPEGARTYTFTVDVNGDTLSEPNETVFINIGNVVGANVADGQGVLTITNDDVTKIHDIQGTAFYSPILAAEGKTAFNVDSTAHVLVEGIVTAVGSTQGIAGFWISEEASDWDADSRTSEGVFVSLANAAAAGITVGERVRLDATVREAQPFATSLPITVLTNTTILSQSNTIEALPTLVLDGTPGHAIPNQILSDDNPNYTLSADGVGDAFDPDSDALDFFETIESMRVTLTNAVVADGFVAGSTAADRFKIYSTDSANASQINSRGGYTVAGDPPNAPPNTPSTGDDTHNGGKALTDGDINPDIVELDFINSPFGSSAIHNKVSMGDQLGAVTGILGFDFSNTKLYITDDLDPAKVAGLGGAPALETTSIVADARSLRIATFNVNNLDPTDDTNNDEGSAGGTGRFNDLARAIANNLHAPDIISIEEIQDNNGAAAGDGISATGADASVTLGKLVAALNAETGKHYQWVDELPVYNAEGGEQSGNIRVAFLYDTDKVQLGGLAANATLAERRQFTDRIGDGVRDAGDRIAFDDSMIGGVDSTSWNNVRKSLMGEFHYNGQTVYVTGNHFKSKGGSGDFYQSNQDDSAGQPANAGWDSRVGTANDVWKMMNLISTASADNKIVEVGDFNDFYFYRPLDVAQGYSNVDGTARVGGTRYADLLISDLIEAERYTYAFDGRSQAIDHILADAALDGVSSTDVVHINTGFNNIASSTDPDPLSDHDPILASFDFRSFAEVVTGGALADVIDGFGGADTLIGLGGNDTLNGDEGNDVLRGGLGDDTLNGGVDFDYADYSDATVGVTVDLSLIGPQATGWGSDTLISIEAVNGSAQGDILTGGALYGYGGSDTLFGTTGADTLDGGASDDLLVGGAGADTLIGGLGVDAVDYGGSLAGVTVNLLTGVNTGGDAQGDVLTGVESVTGSALDDTLTGGASGDRLFGGLGVDTVNGGDGDDVIVGHSTQSQFTGEHDVLNGGTGNDLIYGEAADSIDGGAGTDALITINAYDFAIDLAATSIEYAILDFGNDTVTAAGQTQGVSVFASGGNDTVTGSNFNDTIFLGIGDDIGIGGAGNDVIVGEGGSDRLVGGAGNDALYGGAGDGVQDTFVFSSAGAADADAIYDFVHGVDKIDMSAFATTFAHIGITSLAGAAIVFLDGQHVATVVGAAGTLTASDFIFSSPAPGQPGATSPTGHATSGFDDGGTPTRDVVFSDETPGGMGAVHFSDDTAAPIRATALTAPPEPAFVATGVTFSTLDVSPFDRHAMPWDGAFAVAVISGEDNGHWMV